MKVLEKVLIVFMIVLLCVSFASTYVFAEDEAAAADDWQSTTQFDGKKVDDVDNAAQKIVGSILSVVRIVGTGVSLIMIAFVAMKYMSSAPGDRAEIKKHAVIYVVGAIVLFGGSQLIGIIQEFAKNINS